MTRAPRPPTRRAETLGGGGRRGRAGVASRESWFHAPLRPRDGWACRAQGWRTGGGDPSAPGRGQERGGAPLPSRLSEGLLARLQAWIPLRGPCPGRLLGRGCSHRGAGNLAERTPLRARADFPRTRGGRGALSRRH